MLTGGLALLVYIIAGIVAIAVFILLRRDITEKPPSILARVRINTHSWPSEISIVSSTNRKKKYRVDLGRQECECRDFADVRAEFDYGDPRRFCKHMVKAMVAQERELPPVLDKLLRDAEAAGKGMFLEEVRMTDLGSSGVLVAKSPGGEWFSVLTNSGDGMTRYGYNVLEKRWSYGRPPPNAAYCRRLVESWDR